MQSPKKGFALVLTLFSILLIAVLGLGLVGILLGESSATSLQIREAKAYYMATAGIQRAIAELRDNAEWSTNTTTTATLTDGSYQITVWPDPDNGSNDYKLWKVTSRGTYNDATRELVAWVEQESFAKFAYFTDSEKGNSGQTIWFLTGDKITGPCHTNGYFSFDGHPLFSDRVTSANNSDSCFSTSLRRYRQGNVNYYDPSKFYQYATSYNDDYPMALNGSASFSFMGGQPEIPLPRDTGRIADRATITVNGNSSILFKNDGTMDITKNGETTSYSTSSAVVHVSGSVEVKGTLSGRVTIGATGSISITDNLLYKDKTQDVLGLISNGYIKVSTNKNVQRDLEIDAMIMALNNSFTVDDYDDGVPRGTLRVFGGIVQKNRGPVGTFNSYTNQVSTGYTKDYVYDQKLRTRPPLDFPLTGEIRIRAWQDKGALQ